VGDFDRDEGPGAPVLAEPAPASAAAPALAPALLTFAGGAAGSRLAPARAGSRLAPAQVLRLQRAAGNRAVTKLIVARDDQHKDTHLPTADELAKINVQVNPTAPTAKGGVEKQWDGASGQPDFNNQRAALKAELSEALKNHLDGKLPWLKKQEAAPKLPLANFEGPGRAAKRAVDARYGAYTSAAALTAPVVHDRSVFAFKAGVHLKDRANPAHFTPDPADVADWMAQTDVFAREAQKRHGFNKDRSADEQTFLNDQVIKPFVAARKHDLELYDIYGFAQSSPGQIWISTALASKGAAVAGGPPPPAERWLYWSTWETLVHEYIHTLEHPAFIAMRGGNRILFEGFCEMFTEEVLLEWIPIAKGDKNAALRGEVEGKDGSGNLWPNFEEKMVPAYNPGEYADYVKRAKEIRNILGSGGENAVRAAFFQGHIELIGLRSTGKIASAPTTSAPSGMRFHQVVSDPSNGGKIETADQIATQNGVSVVELQSANPGVDLNALKAGDNVLIPVKP
jgi:hypothetical protein